MIDYVLLCRSEFTICVADSPYNLGRARLIHCHDSDPIMRRGSTHRGVSLCIASHGWLVLTGNRFVGELCTLPCRTMISRAPPSAINRLLRNSLSLDIVSRGSVAAGGQRLRAKHVFMS